MRPVIRSEKFDASGHPIEYKPYGDAKLELIEEIGDFCSFCGKKVPRSSLEVEHIYGKRVKDSNGNNIYAHLEYHWNNFLLGCKNCNSTKGAKDIAQLKPFMPHQNNLLCYLEIMYGGTIHIKQSLNQADKEGVQAYLDLVGLNRSPGKSGYSKKDDRWEYRLTAYDKADKQLKKYKVNPSDSRIDDIIDIALGAGFFSVWFTVFGEYALVQEALIQAFRGTNRNKFDAALLPV